MKEVTILYFKDIVKSCKDQVKQYKKKFGQSYSAYLFLEQSYKDKNKFYDCVCTYINQINLCIFDCKTNCDHEKTDYKIDNTINLNEYIDLCQIIEMEYRLYDHIYFFHITKDFVEKEVKTYRNYDFS